MEEKEPFAPYYQIAASDQGRKARKSLFLGLDRGCRRGAALQGILFLITTFTQ